VNPVEVEDLLKPMLLKDLRIQCRARGINPGGGRETLVDRLRENMLSSGDLCVLVRFL
jgi:SPIRAL1-like protein